MLMIKTSASSHEPRAQLSLLVSAKNIGVSGSPSGILESDPFLVTRTSRDVEHLGQVPGAIGHVVLASSIGMNLVALLERFDMMYRFAHGGVEYRC